MIATAKRFAIAAALAMSATGGVAAATASPWHPAPVTGSPHQDSRPYTPNQCIRLNGGDYNACNVGNSGRGDLPYQPLHTPNPCILLNGGDYTACEVGGIGRG